MTVGESFLVRVGFNFDASRDNLGIALLVEPRFLPNSRLGRVGGVQLPPAERWAGARQPSGPVAGKGWLSGQGLKDGCRSGVIHPDHWSGANIEPLSGPRSCGSFSGGPPALVA